MSILQSLIVFFIVPALNILILLIFARIIMSWLVSFNIMNLRNPLMQQIYYAVGAITEPIMAPVRRLVPGIGGLDLSPILLFFGIQWLVWLFETKIFLLVG
ncbi:MAG: YggT family protein [Maricaulaceae bacterium]